MISALLRIVLIVVATGVAVTSFLFQEVESEALGVSSGSPGTIVRKIIHEAPGIPSSYSGQRLIVVPCISIFASDALIFQSQGTKEAVLRECGRRADGVLDRSSRHAEALLLSAMIAQQRGDIEGAAARVDASRRAAPKDLWLSQIRTSLILRLRRDAPDAWASPVDELATLMASRRGLDYVARLFVASPDLKEEFLSAGALADPEARARFIAAVERLSR
jgi:hypothetical protein